MKKVVLLGDSIRLIGYGTVINQYLPDYLIFQPEENCRFARYTLRLIFELKDQIKDADVIHFNAGVWDTPTLFGDGIPFTPIDEYANTIKRIGELLLGMGKKVIFSTTTPVKKGQPHNTNKRIQQYNEAAIKVLKPLGIEIIDLYDVIYKKLDEYICDDFIHLTEAGMHCAAKVISDVIKQK